MFTIPGEVVSTVRLIASGLPPTVENLPNGYMAFGLITEDGKHHIYGNVGGRIVDLVSPATEMTVGMFQEGVSRMGMVISPAVLNEILEYSLNRKVDPIIASLESEIAASFDTVTQLLNTRIGIPSWNNDTNELIFTTLSGQQHRIYIPLTDIWLDYNHENHTLIFTREDLSQVIIPVGHLIDIYTTEDTATVHMMMDDNVISGAVQPSSIQLDHLSGDVLNRFNTQDINLIDIQNDIQNIYQCIENIGILINTIETTIVTLQQNKGKVWVGGRPAVPSNEDAWVPTSGVNAGIFHWWNGTEWTSGQAVWGYEPT